MESKVVRVTSKGQATIPTMLRRKFGIKAPGLVRFADRSGALVVEPIASTRSMMGILRRASLGPSATRMLLDDRARERRREEAKLR